MPTLHDIITRLPPIEVIGRTDADVRNVVSLEKMKFSPGDISWSSDKNLHRTENLKDVILIVSREILSYRINTQCVYIVVDKPRRYFLQLIREFFVEVKTPEISSRATIAESVRIGAFADVEPGVVIESDCTIGDACSIGSNTVIRKGTVIGNNVKIGANNTIGGVGFGYEKDETGSYEVIPHIGNVIIEDGVEIGNNTTIDRAVLGSTILRRNSKVDNLVHIAHGVDIGENSLVIANAMIAGSVIVGKNVWIAPSSSVLNKATVGDDAVIGMGAVVIKNVESGQTVVGNPAKDILSNKRNI